MSKAYTRADFTEQITADRTWRLKEISDLKALILGSQPSLRPVLLRALVTLSYAHWEGYVRFAAEKYLEHVSLKKLKLRQLNRQFTRNFFLPRLLALSKNRPSVQERCDLIDAILNSDQDRFARVHESLYSTKSNLNFEVFADICLVCDVDHTPFSSLATFIDVVLLKRRNAVAHGEDTFINVIDIDEVANGTIGLMRQFGDALENIVVTESYRSK